MHPDWWWRRMEESPSLGDKTIEFNGKVTKIRDLPGQSLRAGFGFGHFGVTKETIGVDGFEWLYKPWNCEFADKKYKTRWVKNGTILVCLGCGLDCT